MPACFKPTSTLKQKTGQPKLTREKRDLVYVGRRSEECTDLFIGESTQPLNHGPTEEGRLLGSRLSSLSTPEGLGRFLQRMYIF